MRKEKAIKRLEKDPFGFLKKKNKFADDKDIVLLAVKKYGPNLEFASDRLKNDKEVVMEAVARGGINLKYASEELRKDREVVLAAVTKEGYALEYASPELQKDREIVDTALLNNGDALQYASDEYKICRETLLEVVKTFRGGAVLQFVPEEFRDDEEIIETAAKYSRFTMKKALSKRLINDKAFVKKILLINPYLLQWAPENIKDDNEMVLDVITKTKAVLVYACASERVRNDTEAQKTVRKIAVEKMESGT